MTATATQHTSHMLTALTKQLNEKNSISLKEMIGSLGERGFGLSILLFCIPNILPIPNVAGLSALTGIPIGLFGLQMMLGRPHLWLPAALGKRRFSGPRAAKIAARAIPVIAKVEKWFHPRLQVMQSKAMQRVLGFIFMLLAIIMSLPIPFGNFMPGFAMALIAIGLIERDGVLVLLGLLMGAATITLMFTVADAILFLLQ